MATNVLKSCVSLIDVECQKLRKVELKMALWVKTFVVARTLTYIYTQATLWMEMFPRAV